MRYRYAKWRDESAQISKAGADFEIVEREILSRIQDTSDQSAGLWRCHMTCSRKKPVAGIHIRAFQDTKWRHHR